MTTGAPSDLVEVQSVTASLVSSHGSTTTVLVTIQGNARQTIEVCAPPTYSSDLLYNTEAAGFF